MPHAVIYARFSPRRLRKDAAGGTKECESNAAQIEACKAFAEAEGFDVLDTHQDDALSGGASLDEDASERPGLWAAVDAVPRGGYLLVYKFDRLGRDGFLLADIKRSLFSKRAAIISASDGERIDAHLSPSEKLRFAMIEAFAEYERAMIRQRTKWAMRRHQSKGLRMGREDRLPYGWRIDPASVANAESQQPCGMQPDEEEQAVVAEILRLRRAGTGLREIGRTLTTRGIACRGGPWYHGTIRQILRREGIA